MCVCVRMVQGGGIISGRFIMEIILKQSKLGSKTFSAYA